MIDTAPVNRVVPTPEMIRLWADELIPGDIWYWDDSPLDLDLTGCQVMTREAYRSDPTYSEIRFMNAYCEWQMPAEATHVIVSDRAWIGALPDSDRQRVLQLQVDLKRGLVFPAAWFGELPNRLQPFAVADQVVLGDAIWADLPSGIQDRVLLAEQRRWDEVNCFPAPEGAPAHVQAVANTFCPHEGTNCFAIAAYGATADSDLLAIWLRSGFLDLIAANGYRQAPGNEPRPDDIVIFESQGRLVHAAYCVGDDRFLNKNGQSRFNPIRIVNWATLGADWRDATCVIYQRLPALNGGRR